MTNDATGPLLDYMHSSSKEKVKIIFWDFKYYWHDVIEVVKTRFKESFRNSIDIMKWEELDYSSFDSVIDKTGNLLKSKYNENILHIFVAPITWAGLYTDYFTILGPAFATFGDIKLYSIRDKRKTIGGKRPNANITIAVIDKLATSTISLQIIMKGICEQIGNGERLNYPIDEPHYDTRLQSMKENIYTAAVFNEEDITKMKKEQLSEVNDIADIDELYALAKRITNLPRVVYAVSKQQLGAALLEEQTENLIDTLREIKIDLPNRVLGKKHILSPFNDLNRKAVIEFIKDGQRVFPELKEKYLYKKFQSNFYNP